MKNKLYILLIFSICSAAWSQEEPVGLRRYAIFAGSNNGGEERVQLEYAETDAMAMYRVLSEVGGLSPSDTILLKDPDVREIRDAFSQIQSKISENKEQNRRSEFIFYYSGHSDEAGILPGGKLYEYSELRKKIDAMDTEVKIAVLDSCSSGSFTRLKGGVKKAPFLIDESVDTKGHAFLTSSSENEAAQESDSIEGSYFTHYLITALRGAGDSTQDGTVTLTEAYSFAADETLARTTSSIAGAQHPSYSINLTGSGDLVLTDLREIVSSISIDKEIDGRIFFRDKSDRLVIEFRKRAGIPVSISLPGGVYKVQLENERGLSSAEVTVTNGETHLNNRAFTGVDRTFARVRGDDIPESEPEKPDWDNVENSLEQKMKEIRNMIDDKFGIMETEEENHDSVQEDIVENVEYKVFGVSFAPTRETANDVLNLSLSFIGKPYALYGASIGFMNMTYQDVYGVQIGALSNQTGRDNNGALISSIFNITNRDLRGAALSGVFNLTNGTVYGMQGAGVFNISSYRLMGFQTAGVFNITKNYSYGAQAAGVFNITEGTLSGFQTAGVFNIAGGQLNGAQISGVFNVADNINGVQIGLINVGKQVNGMQIGLINISDEIKGLPIGLLTISKNGILDFGGWYESSGFIYTGLQTGSRNFYNFAYLALPSDSAVSVFSAGIGIGARINLGSFYIDMDTSIKSVAIGSDYGEALKNTFTAGNINSVYPNARLSAGLKMFRVLSLYGGLSLDMHIPGVTNRSEYFHSTENPLILHNPENGEDVIEFHPHWFGGLKINF